MSVVKYKAESGIGFIKLNRPEAYNAMSDELREGLIEKVSAALHDQTVSVVMIMGEGKSFSSGGDVKKFAERELDLNEQRDHLLSMNELVQDLYYSPKPVITAINGYAVGAGLSLALCGDLILCSKDAKFSAPFLRLGLAADMGLSFLASRRIGTERTKRILLTGEMIDADTAEQWGLVDWVVEETNDLESRALEVAKNLAESSSLAVGVTKSMMNHVHQSSFTAILNQELANQNLLFLSPEYREGVQAFIEKRKPLFHREK